MKMKTFLIVCALVAVAYAAPKEEKEDSEYTHKYDNVDIDQILNNDRLLDNYMKCLTETGNCTPDGNELKKILPDALQTECKKCSPGQKEKAEKVIRFLAKNKRAHWQKLVDKYDPNGEFKKNYEHLAKEKGIEV